MAGASEALGTSCSGRTVAAAEFACTAIAASDVNSANVESAATVVPEIEVVTGEY